ncbi:MAG: hypothetical protein GDA36_04300 [Rhodobacteraceae bacterium]|nr:hypothetical protein [Paracoccaceae bacterium]
MATVQGALLAQALSANTRLRVRPFDHGIKPGAPGQVRRCGVSQMPFVDLVDETFLVRAPSGRTKPLDLIFSPDIRFAPFLPHHAALHIRIVGRIVEASASTGFCGASMWLLGWVILDLTANLGQKIIVGCENGNGSAHRAQVHQRLRPQNSMKSNRS